MHLNLDIRGVVSPLELEDYQHYQRVPLPTAEDDPIILNRPGWQLALGAIPNGLDDRPPEDIVRGRCPECGDELVANMYWHPERSYLLRYECWQLLQSKSCGFYAVP